MARITDRDLEQAYIEMLDEVYGTVKIAGLEYDTSQALKDIDPVAFRCGLADYISSRIGEDLWEVDGEYTDEDPEDAFPTDEGNASTADKHRA